MKQRYTITIADMEMNVISEESPETVETLVGIVDRKMREIMVASRRCTKSEAALLCALDYCSDKLKSLRKVKQNEAAIAEQALKIEELEKKNERLYAELETLKESLHAAQETIRMQKLQEAEAEAVQASETPAEEVAAPAMPEEAPAETVVPPVVFEEAPAASPAIAPEDVEFDPTEIFMRAKNSRNARRGARKSRK